MRISRVTLAAAAFAALASTASAHGGGLNADGCHNSRKTGDYHCHRPQASPPARPALGQTRGLSSSGEGVSYRNCSEARAAGAAPVRRGAPGYGAHLDRDGDGKGCE